MPQKFTGRNKKDVEAASDTIIHNMEFSGSIYQNKLHANPTVSITGQTLKEDGYGGSSEKRSKKH